jgi:hypothetical protein
MTAAGARPDPGFVGRVDEVARLTEAVRAAQGGSAPLCLVIGEAGIGKSRLAARLAGEARGLGFDVVWTEAEADAGPFSALAGLRTRGEAVPSADDARWDQLDAAAAAIAARAPVLVIVEDFHWADESSAWVVERLGRQLQGVAAPLLVTARSDEPGQERIAGLLASADHVVRLAGLSLAETTRLAELAAPGTAVNGSGLYERTGGVPLFVREAAVLDAEGGGPQVAAGLLGRRIARLGPATARVLAALALAPPGTSLVLLARSLHCGVGDVVAAIDAARAENLVVDETGGGVRFRHALLSEAATDGLPAAERRTLRLALADALAAEGTTTALANAARQRLLALPAGDVNTAATAALEAITALRTAGDDAAASALAGLGASVLPRYGAPAAQIAQFHLERAEALFTLGDMELAQQAYGAAATAGDALGAELRARTEVGLAWFSNPFVPDLGAVHQLEEAAAALDEADSPLRVRLLGRIAVASVASPAAQEVGHRAAEEAVAMARRIGDPALLVQALADRHLAPHTVADFAAREQVAAEIVELGERLGRPEVALLGYEWQFGERLGHADVDAAEAALERLELYAHLTPSPRWRFAAGIRRACLASLRGDRDEALRLLAESVRPAAGWLNPGELYGIEMGFRTSTVILFGQPDPELGPLYERNVALIGDIPAPFLHASLGLTSWVLGEEDRARMHVARATSGMDTVAVGLESVFALNVCGLAAAAIPDIRMARAVRPLLEPFAERLTAGGSIVAPVGTTLGLVCSLLGDSAAAEQHHRAGIATAVRAGSDVMAARCRALAAGAPVAPGPRRAPESPAAPESPTVATVGDRGTIARDGSDWVLASPFGTVTVEESRGLLQLVEVLRANGREVSALDLGGTGSGGSVAVQSDLGPALDGRAKREYRARIADLREEIDEADAMNDPDRASRARWELDALLDELGRAVGLSGRDRPQGATDERARVNVTRSIKRAIAAVGAGSPELGSHLEVSVRTGRQCRYQPDPAVALTWEVSATS